MVAATLTLLTDDLLCRLPAKHVEDDSADKGEHENEDRNISKGTGDTAKSKNSGN